MWRVSQLRVPSDFQVLSHVHTKDVLMIAVTLQSDLFVIISIWKISELKYTIPHGFDASVVKKGRNSLGKLLLTWQHEARHVHLRMNRKASWFHSLYCHYPTGTGCSVTYSCCQSWPFKTVHLAKIQLSYARRMRYESEVAGVLRQGAVL